MKVNWLVEKEGVSEDLNLLIEAVKKQGYGYEVCPSYVPKGEEETFLKLFRPDECVVYYGSLQMARQIQRTAKWIPGVYCSLEKFECTYYYPFFGDLLLNRNYVMLPFGELLRRKEFLFSTLGKDGAVFVRPSSGFKIFTGKLTYEENWAKEIEMFGLYDVEPDRVVIVAEPHNLVAEWRFVVVDSKVISGSQYRMEYGNKFTENVRPEVYNFAQKAADISKYNPDRVWVLDICERKDGQLFVLEVGCFSCAGLYAIPKDDIVNAVSNAALKEWKEHRE